MAIPTVPGSPVWYLFGDDVDGLGTGNASLTNGQLLTDWSNTRGSAGGTATQGNAAIYDPTLLKAANNGRDAVVFSQDRSHLVLTGSATSLNFIHQTGAFDIVMVFRLDYCGPKNVLTGSDTGTDKGLGLQTTATNAINPFLTSGAATNVNFSTATQVFTQGEWWVLRLRGDGTKMYLSQDGGAEQSSSNYANAFGTGNATHDMGLGADYWAGTPAYEGMLAAFVAIWATPLSSGQWSTLLADLQSYYAI